MNAKFRTLVVCSFLSIPVAPSATAQEFEAADVHVSAGVPALHLPALNSEMRGGLHTGGRYELRTATMVDLISTACSVDTDKVIGGPDWLNKDEFDLVAKAPADATPQSLRLMLSALLANRFALSVHRETRPLSGYALIAGNHAQLKPGAAGPGRCDPVPQIGTPPDFSISCHDITMTEFAVQLSRFTGDYLAGYPVADLTSLPGTWTFTLNWTRRNRLRELGTAGISLTAALEKQTGLRLEIQKVPTPVIVVDSVNRKPTANPPGALEKLPASPTRFEVADIRHSAPETTKRNIRLDPGGRVELRGFTLADLIKAAWELTDLDAIDYDDMVIGVPRWPERFDIVAKAPAPPDSSQPAPRLDMDSASLLLRSLLADRFLLKTHTTQQSISVLALVAAKPKLTKADPANRPNCRNAAAPSGSPWVFSVVCHNTTMAKLAEGLPAYGALYIPHPVVDKTGLSGGWDFTISWSPPHLVRADEASAPTDPNGSITIVEAIEKQLGLKLEPTKLLMPVLVIDHVEREPTEN